MGRNYGHRRERLGRLMVSNIIGAAIGESNLKYSHLDEQEYADYVNRRLEIAEERIRNIDL